MGKVLIDRIGEVHGYWTVLKYAGNLKWTCICRCGNIKDVRTTSLRYDRSKSCGCFQTPNDLEYNERTKKRLLSKVNFNSNGCWEWLGALMTNGYGQTSYRKKVCVNTSRLSWKMWKGEIPDNLYVLHKCDNRKCINPDHLFLGTHQDNMNDMWEKGRGIKGKKHHWYNNNKEKNG